MKRNNRLLTKLLNARQGKSQLIFAAFALGIGALLLLCAVQAYVDVNQLLYGRNNQNDMADFLIINKKITNQMMGDKQATLFTPEEIKNIRQQPFIKAVGLIISNQFRVTASGGRSLPFATDLFFESVPDSFLEHIPDHWHWQPGDQVLPVILSSDFLNLYNYGFALSQDLPQLSAASIKAIPISVTISGNGNSASFLGNIAGFSDRISSILVPESFMNWANQNFGYERSDEPPSRLILKVDDPSSPAFVKFLNSHNYVTNEDKLRFSKTRMIVQSVVSIISAFGIFILLLSLIIFSIYIRLVISRSQDEIRLLVTLGFSPAMLSKFLLRKMIPLFALVLAASLIIVGLLQIGLYNFLTTKQLSTNMLVSYMVIIITIVMFGTIYWVNKRAIRQSVSSIQ
jgi:hypothetical protein